MNNTMVNYWIFAGLYLQLGYCHADSVRALGLMRLRRGSLEKVSWVGFVVVMLLWSVGLMILADRIKATSEWWKG